MLELFCSHRPRPGAVLVAAVAAGLLLLSVAIGAPPARAQSDAELRLLLERIDRLERQLGAVQGRLDSGTGGATAGAGASLPPTAAARMELRVSQLEDEIRSMNGRLEELGFGVRQLRERLETAVSDMELRLAALEGAPAGKRSKAPAPVVKAAPPAASPAPPAAASGSPREQYDRARALLGQGAYAEAEGALRQFLAANPKDKLAGSAQFWLGETFYVRKQYEDAAVAYSDGYKKYPKGPKGADMLLKLGMSLAHLGSKDAACASFRELRGKYPKARGTIRKTAASQRRKLGC